jgi:hypothetical protein
MKLLERDFDEYIEGFETRISTYVCLNWKKLSFPPQLNGCHAYPVTVHFVPVYFFLLQLVLILFEGVDMGVGEGESEGGEDELKGDGF